MNLKKGQVRDNLNNGGAISNWGNIQSGAAISAMSPQAQTKSLSVLNKMIGEEQQKLDDLENKFHTNTFDKNDSEDGILID